jgi:UDP-N-acetylglucosamine 2-epimerase (non-hydrolysing)
LIHFVVGTRAQLFKMAPIMLECEEQGLKWRWVYTAQHKDTIEETLKTFGLPKPDYTVVRWDTEAKTMGKVFGWFGKMLLSLPKSKKILAGYTGKNHVVLTHGDTLTTWFAALMGRLTGTRVMHIEAGLRSFNLFKPFPEEINRLITFRLSHYYACPGDWAVSNLKKFKGEKLNTKFNTQIDTVRFGQANCEKDDFKVPKEKYVLVSLHRYENIFKKERFLKIIEELEKTSKQFKILFVQHPATFGQIDKYGFRRRLEKNPNINLLPRLEYLPFIKAAKHSEFVITDGGGNQEELYYMGKPTLIFRNETERKEGIGSTAVLSKLDNKIISNFVDNYKTFSKDPITSKHYPSRDVVNFLKEKEFGRAN